VSGLARAGARSPRLVLGALALVTVLAFLASLAVGPAGFGVAESLAALAGGDAPATALIVREVRLPRALLGLMIGATLGLAGAALQGFLRNPLAEPGLIGVSASAALGAVLVFYTGLAGVFALALPLGGLLGALAAVALVQLLAGRDESPLTLILAGVAVTSFAAALTSLALNLVPSPYAALEIVFWMMGSLADRSFDHVWLAAPFMIAGCAVLATLGRALEALTLGEDAARTLGFDLRRVRRRVVLGTALSVGAATSVAGAIGFVGLVVPHLLRPLVGHSPGRLLPASALGGAALTLLADVAVRVLSPGRELKLGVLTALVGAPFFLYLILDARRRLA
jgi:iron complex transport system permease protein